MPTAPASAQHAASVTMAGRQHQLGHYKHASMAEIACDMAELLHFHFADSTTAAAGDASGPPRALPPMRCLDAGAYQERQEWKQLASCSSLDVALSQMVESGLPEQMYYEYLYSGSEDDYVDGEEEEVAAGVDEERELSDVDGKADAVATAIPGAAAVASGAGEAAVAGRDGGGAAEAPTPAEEGQPLGCTAAAADATEQLSEQQQQQVQLPKLESEPSTGGQPADGAEQGEEGRASPDAYGSGSAAAEAAAALAELAALAGTDWDALDDEDADASPESGMQAGGSAASPLDRRRGVRRARPAKLWCRYPLDEAQWALVLGGSVIDSRSISLPWTNPGDMACELLGTSWVADIRRRDLSGTARKTAVVLDAQHGQFEVTYALYARTDPRKDTRPQYIEKISPLLQRHAAVVGDVLLLLPEGPARLRSTLLRADTEEAAAVHRALSFDVEAEQEAWRRKRAAAHTRHPPKAPVLRRSSQQAQAPGEAARQQAGAGSRAPSQAGTPGPPAGAAAPGTALAGAGEAGDALPDVKRRASEQEAAAEAVDEMMQHLHKRPKREHGSDSRPVTPHSVPSSAPAGTAVAAATTPAGLSRQPNGLQAQPGQAQPQQQLAQYQALMMNMLQARQQLVAQQAAQQGKQGKQAQARAAAAAGSSARPAGSKVGKHAAPALLGATAMLRPVQIMHQGRPTVVMMPVARPPPPPGGPNATPAQREQYAKYVQAAIQAQQQQMASALMQHQAAAAAAAAAAAGKQTPQSKNEPGAGTGKAGGSGSGGAAPTAAEAQARAAAAMAALAAAAASGGMRPGMGPYITLARPPMLVKSTSVPAEIPSPAPLQPQPQLQPQKEQQQQQQQSPGGRDATPASESEPGRPSASNGEVEAAALPAAAPPLIRSKPALPEETPAQPLPPATVASSSAAAAAAAATEPTAVPAGAGSHGGAAKPFLPMLVRSTPMPDPAGKQAHKQQPQQVQAQAAAQQQRPVLDQAALRLQAAFMQQLAEYSSIKAAQEALAVKEAAALAAIRAAGRAASQQQPQLQQRAQQQQASKQPELEQKGAPPTGTSQTNPDKDVAPPPGASGTADDLSAAAKMEHDQAPAHTEPCDADGPSAPAAAPPADPPAAGPPEASASLARMGASMERLARDVAVRLSPERGQAAELARRLHGLAAQLDGLIGQLWAELA